MNFRPITIADKNIITEYTYESDFKNCDFAFSNMCSWRFLYESEFAAEDGFLFIRFNVPDKKHNHKAYMFPVGKGNLAHAINKIEKDAATLNLPLLILGITDESKIILEKNFPNEFTYMTDRNYFDYIYLREDLQFLKGKKFQAKRNHINKFNKLYQYSYIPLTQEIAPQCMELEQIWLNLNVSEQYREALANERRSLCFALKNFTQLELHGGAIVVDNKIIAFSCGSKINRNTFGVHVEKADITYEGIFSVINREFVSHLPQEYIYINREEDLGIAGLRKAKLSYNPVMLLAKNGAMKRKSPALN
ncbi:MAG: phosphatidylglycerol lysyltransferase domain-containing protein [Tannerella sp.]|nr:phosphatidylglycerol lysyltransferase domain-containing protein [Tannerella sp.]